MADKRYGVFDDIRIKDAAATNYTSTKADWLSGHLAGIDSALGNWYGLSWNETTDTYTRRGSLAGYAAGVSPGNYLLPIQSQMRRCILSDTGVVQYYLNPTDSTKKADGSTANLDGTDGQVMVEIPKFYIRYSYSSPVHTWDISLIPLDGFFPHPAFFKDGAWVDHRYIGAYEGSMYDDSEGAMATDAVAVAASYASGDILCSVSGQCPKTNETRAEFRAMASERGVGWRQQDYFLSSAIQLLYLVEYADFDSQTTIGNGRTMFSDGSWVIAGTGGYIGQTGYSNSDGNGTNATDRAATLNISAIDTSGVSYQDYMSYRGIENFFGNVWKWVDGLNINDNIPYVCNNESNYADNTDTNYTRLVDIGGSDVTLHNANGYIGALEQLQSGFLPADVTGSSTTKICDSYYQDAGWRVGVLGGYAYVGAGAGCFCWILAYSSGSAGAVIGARLGF